MLICSINKQKPIITMETMTKEASASISTDILLAQWLGHRHVTRRVIEAFPEDKMFTFSIGGMRTFAQLITEVLALGAPGMRGVVTGTWLSYQEAEAGFKFTSKTELLELWDKSTEEIKTLWAQVPPKRFFETDKFLGQYESPVYWSIMYVMDNEIHHRAQAYVYLRALNVEPPPFWDRG
jgi:uncharacterized damage-inducible protein DinB